MRKTALILAILAALLTAPAGAQNGGRAALSAPDVAQFPTITAYFTVTDAGGVFVHGLTPADVTLLEDDQAIQPQSLLETRPGVRLFVAVNAGPALALRDANGVSRYDLLSEALAGWAQGGEGSGGDQYGLVVNGAAAPSLHTTRQAWLEAFQAYAPDLRASVPSLASLSLALSQAAVQPAGSGASGAVLYLTPPPSAEDLTEVANLAARARAAGTPVFVWLVPGREAVDSPAAQALADLAAQSGGQFFAFTGSETIPDVNAYLDPLGSVYQLTYLSQIKAGGQHSLAVHITRDGEEIAAAQQAFKLDVQPPNPIFLSPPAEVVRRAPEGSRHPLEELNPARYPLRVLVEFPDEHPRALQSLRLYADGELIAEAEGNPPGFLVWDLSTYTQKEQQVLLRLEVVDALGLSRSSLETPVTVRTEIPPPTLGAILAENSLILGGLAVLLAGSLLAVILVRGSRMRSARARQSRQSRRDPVTQPVPIRESQPAARPAQSRGLRWPRRAGILPATAELVHLREGREPVTGKPIPISARETTFGRDPSQAAVVIDAPSVDGLHARLSRLPDGAFILSDLGSVAGTWVNYAPVSGHGTRLEHGDLIHIGRAAFRFQLTRPGRVPKPQVEPFQDES